MLKAAFPIERLAYGNHGQVSFVNGYANSADAGI
jgi:hypothetical protein